MMPRPDLATAVAAGTRRRDTGQRWRVVLLCRGPQAGPRRPL